MCHCDYYSIIAMSLRRYSHLHPILLLSFCRVYPRIIHIHINAIAFKLSDNINHTRIPQIRAILLERQPHNQCPRAFYRYVARDHFADCAADDIAAHTVVNAAPGEDNFGVVADRLSFLRQIVGVNADAVTADEAGPERKEVPFGACRVEYILGVDIELVENEELMF